MSVIVPKYVHSKLTVCRVIKRAILLALFSFLLVGGVVLGKLYHYAVENYLPVIKGYWEDSNNIAANADISDFMQAQTGYIYDKDGNVLLTLKTEKDTIWVTYDELPESVIEAFVAIEDRRFWKHEGVDWASTMKAFYLLKTGGGEISRGGSTITQQLARNVFLSFETSYERKFREIFLAMALEEKYSKEEILEYYINTINFANGYYGIGAAAKGYFGKDVSECSVEEIAFLCSIPNNPSYYNPLTHPENTLVRRNVILKEMKDQEFLSEEAYLKACNVNCEVLESKYTEANDYAASFALWCSIRWVMENIDNFEFEFSWETMKDYEEYMERYAAEYAVAKSELFSKGYKIYTSLDQEAQQSIQNVLTNTIGDVSNVDGALTVVDNKTGLVVASVGGKEPSQNLGLNKAFQEYRQPGSSIKPLLVYTPAIENLDYNANTVVDDTFEEGGPKNAGSYSGRISLRSAVEQSKNVVAWKVFRELGSQNGLKYLNKMQYSRIVPQDGGLASALGGLTFGVTTNEMAGGYAALVNGGIWREPSCLEKVTDPENNVLWERDKGDRVYAKDAAGEMVDILTGVPIRGTARGLVVCNGCQIAGKTGTTNGTVNTWFCGFSSYYTICVWVGSDTGKSVSTLGGTFYARSIWRDSMNYLIKDLPAKKLEYERKVKVYKKPEKESTQKQDEEKKDEGKYENSEKVEKESEEKTADVEKVKNKDEEEIVQQNKKKEVSTEKSSEVKKKKEDPIFVEVEGEESVSDEDESDAVSEESPDSNKVEGNESDATSKPEDGDDIVIEEGE